MLNTTRMEYGLSPLKLSQVCQSAAEEHAQNMWTLNFYGHNSPTESWGERMDRYGLTKSAENIAIADSAQFAHNQWMNSTEHRKNILRTEMNFVGVAVRGNRWVECFH